MRDQQDRDYVAWDIETTGFTWNDRVTVSRFWLPHGQAVLVLNTDGEEVDTGQLEQELESVNGGVPVTIHAEPDEQSVLERMVRVVLDRFERDYNTLVAFNAESWKGGFDLPFVRTRCVHHGVDWVFNRVLFTDLWEPVKKRVNTTYTAHGKSDSVNSLTGSYRLFSDRVETLDAVVDAPDRYVWYAENQYDPFSDSGSAARHYNRGEYLSVCQHNLADIHRTWELGELIRRYAPSKEVRAKKL
jgi:hypothetical protein